MSLKQIKHFLNNNNRITSHTVYTESAYSSTVGLFNVSQFIITNIFNPKIFFMAHKMTFNYNYTFSLTYVVSVDFLASQQEFKIKFSGFAQCLFAQKYDDH